MECDDLISRWRRLCGSRKGKSVSSDSVRTSQNSTSSNSRWSDPNCFTANDLHCCCTSLKYTPNQSNRIDIQLKSRVSRILHPSSFRLYIRSSHTDRSSATLRLLTGPSDQGKALITRLEVRPTISIPSISLLTVRDSSQHFKMPSGYSSREDPGQMKKNKQSMADLKLRRLTELNTRLREDLERERISVSQASKVC
jgi:hypothetical protein